MQQATHPKLKRTAFAFSVSLGLVSLLPGTVGAQGSIRERETLRRQQLTADAEALLEEGREAYAKGEYEEAVQKYRSALSKLPGGAMTENRRRAITAHLADGSVALAQDYRRTGKYDEARTLLEGVLIADPGSSAARQGLDYLDDPIRTNPALTYEHTQDIDKVRRHLYTGEGLYNLAKFNEAMFEFEAALRIDPYNTAARRWMERISKARSDYYRAAYDETRARLLADVDKAWEISVPPAPGEDPGRFDPTKRLEGGEIYLTNKLKTIIIPSVDFDGSTVEEAIDFLRLRSKELDPELDPDRKGINFVIRKARIEAGGAGADLELDAEAGLGGGGDPGTAMIKELKLKNVPLATVLTYICDQAGLRYKVDEFAVTLLPLSGAEGDEPQTRRWSVPPTFLTDIEGESSGGGGGEIDPFAPDAGGGLGGGLEARKPLIEILKDAGISFPPGTSATYLAGSSKLVVKNTPSNLDLVDALVVSITDNAPKMIKILTKFVEVNQENTDELSFDWIITPVGLGGIVADDLFLGGGTIGSGTARTAADFISPVAYTTIPGIPAGSSQDVKNIATGGLRSGDAALTRNSIDAILNNPGRSSQNANVAPGILSLTGLFNDGQFQMIMRGLAQKKGADIMTAPSVTARPGQKATIEIIREFIYPTEYEPPELPNSIGGGGNNNDGGNNGGIFPVTPATPTAFETRNTGVTLEIEPNVGANNYVIDLRFAPEIVEFEGFINYGSPITSPASDAFGNPVSVTITENRIEMPIFSSRRVSTGITIYDGHTVAVGGLMREDIQNVEDKVPVLGDLPFIGRLFQSKAQNHIKSNLIIFVTAQIIDATGRPLRQPNSSLDVGGGSVDVDGGAGILPDLGAL